MKKSYNITILLTALMVLFNSCEDFLDVKPQQAIDSDIALSTSDNVKATLVGAYVGVRSRWIFGSQFNEYAELLGTSGHLQHVGSNMQPKEIIDKNIIVDNSYVESSWIESYAVINTLNNVIKAIDVVDESDQDRVEGEALFLRGLLYFEMTKLWGLPYEPNTENNQLAVPIVVNPTLAAIEAIPVPRNTVEECYTQILEDLTTAKSLLPEANGFWANKYAASSVLARVYLQMGDFQNAATEANWIIEDSSFELVTTPQTCFNNSQNSSEDIFALQNTLTSNSIWLTERYESLNGMGRGDYQVTETFLEQFNANDLRGQVMWNTESSYTWENIDSMYYIGVGLIRNGGINTFKWANYYANIPLIRLAEIYLIRAEANFELMDLGLAAIGESSPLADVNTIRQRALAPTFMGPITRDQICNERYLELCWEGHRLHDLKRWKQNIGVLPYDAGNLILPIPIREMETNNLLVQNDFYN